MKKDLSIKLSALCVLLLLGFSTLIGYLLQLEFSYDKRHYLYMVIPMALGFMLLSAGLWSAWFTSRNYPSLYQKRADKKMLAAAAAVVFAIVIIAGFAGFAVSSQYSEKLIAKNLQQALQLKKNEFLQMLQQPLSNVINLQDADILQQLAQQSSVTVADRMALTKLMNSAQMTNMQIYNAQNQLLATLGQVITKPELRLPINLPFAANLLWKNGLYVHFTAPILSQGKEIGYFITESPLNFTGQVNNLTALGKTAELVICARHNKNEAICLPGNTIAKPFTLTLMENGRQLPMEYALLGKSNTVIAEDYRHNKVMAAYSPIDRLGLGMVTKMDTAEIYLPIRSQLQILLPLVLVTLAAGLLLLYWQMLPLLRRLVFSEERLLTSEASLQAIISNIADGVITMDKQGKIESVNPKLSAIFDYEASEIVGNNISMLTPPHLQSVQTVDIQHYLTTSETHSVDKSAIEITGQRRNGEPFPIEFTLTDVKLDDKHLLVGILRDISARKATEASLFESEARFRTAFDAAAVGMSIISLEGHWLKVNQAFCQMIGYTEEELLQRDFQSITHAADLIKDLKQMQQLLANEAQHYNIEKRYIHKNTSSVWVLLSVSLIRDKQGTPLYFIAQIQDITTRKQAEERLKAMAYSDALTGLANRVQLENNLKIALFNASRYQQRLAVIFLDLDDFKNVNDTLGHDAGDLLLQVIASRLQTCVRGTDTVARMGGDEFVLLIAEASSIESVALIAQKIINEITHPVSVKGYELHITTSIGISCYPDDGQDVETLLKNADMALYRAKLLGRNNYQFCTKEMTVSAQERLNREKALQQALEKNEFVLLYQPIISTSTKTIVGVEALLRWNSPEFGVLGSADIIPLAEETGLIYVIGAWIIENACQQLQSWYAAGLKDLRLSINISPRQFKHLDFISMIKNVLQTVQFPARNLELQITENLFVNNPQQNLVVLEELTQLGIKIAIDNFGTGYSSLSYLQQLTINRINIDRTFIATLLTENSSLDVVKAAIAMAGQLNIKVCAEGVENLEQYNLLAEYGCSEIQGYFVSVPLPTEQITAFLARYSHTAISFLS